MSNYLAIATVTATLQRILQSSVQGDVDGARVTTVKPSNLGSGTPESGVNIFLYQVTPNHVWAKNNMHPRGGKPANRTQVALDLHYLLSFYGNEVELEPQRLMGSVIRTLSDRAILTPETIEDAIADSTFTFLADSNLAAQVEMIQLKAVDLSLDELSKVWSVLVQTSYALSLVYECTVVIIEGEDPGKIALPVRQSRPIVVPFSSSPLIERVVSQAGGNQPILIDSTLIIRGKQLRGEVTRVRICGVEVTPPEVSETQIVLPLSSVPGNSLHAGIQSLQVVHPILTGTPPQLTRGVESNAAPFVLRPTINKVTIFNIQGSGDELRSAEVTVNVNVAIAKQQRVVLLLNEISLNSPVAYIFEATRRRGTRYKKELATNVEFSIRNVKSGKYLVRVQVDGAESLLEVDMEPDSKTFEQYIGHKVVIY